MPSSPATTAANAVLVLCMTFVSLDGLVCADGRDSGGAMACCRDAHHCNTPEKSRDANDRCCKPNRSSENPASVDSLAGKKAARSVPVEAVLPAVAAMERPLHAVVPSPRLRGSPVVLTNRPLDTPLLN